MHTAKEKAVMAGDNHVSEKSGTVYLCFDPKDRVYGGARCVINEEIKYIEALRSARAKVAASDNAGAAGPYAADPSSDLVGLALSGGGIRSASFGLGVMQSLARAGWMRRVDYLSTVSGGGYIGTCLTWLLHQTQDEQHPFGLGPRDFPFGTRRPQCATGFSAGETANDAVTTDGMNAVLYWLRQHAKFLVPGQGLNLAALLAVTAGNTFVSLCVYFPLLCGVYFVLLRLSNHLLPVFTAPLAEHGVGLAPIILGLTSLGLMATLSLLYALGSFLFRNGAETLAFRLRTNWAIAMGVLLTLALFLLLAGSVPYVSQALNHVLHPYKGESTAITATATALAGLIPAWGTFRQKRSGSGDSWLVGPVTSWLGGMLLIYGLLLLAHASLLAVTGDDPLHHSPGYGYLVLLLPLLVGSLADMNSVSMHRYYRDRLMGTFLPQLAGDSRVVEGGNKADRERLHKVCVDQDPRAPYHLINTNVVLVDAGDPRFRGRGGDSFVLSPRYCGSLATGWRKTEDFMGKSVTLASAMAASGAALNPAAGVAGRGSTRDRALSFLLRIANVRLGYWVVNPGRDPGFIVKPKFLWPGIAALCGLGFHEHSRFVELTDGGHFENLGIYELVRRRCKLIIAVDAGADPKYQFDDLANVIERVRADFGVKIAIGSEDLQPLLPSALQPGKTCCPCLAERGWLYADVSYPNPDPNSEDIPGTLIYITTTVTKGLPADLYGYKMAHPEFPDEPTSDQFFDEQQFEAYRELGYQITRDMLFAPQTSREAREEGVLAALGLSAPRSKKGKPL